MPNGDGDRQSNRRDGAFGIALTPQLVSLVRTLQRDLRAGLAESASACAWVPVRCSAQLTAVVCALTIAVIWTAGMRVVPRLDISAVARGQAVAASYEPVTLALLAPYAAFGLMALMAAFLQGFGSESRGDHFWRPAGRCGSMC